MSTENKPQEFILADNYISVTLKDGTLQSFRVACSKVEGATITGEHIHVIEISAVEQLKAEVDNLEQQNSEYKGLYEESRRMRSEIAVLKSKLAKAKTSLDNALNYLHWREDDLIGDDLIGDGRLTAEYKNKVSEIEKSILEISEG